MPTGSSEFAQKGISGAAQLDDGYRPANALSVADPGQNSLLNAIIR
jgi:hypothetical protein